MRAVGITLSEQQAELARERVRRPGLADRVEIRVADYREVADGPYDKIASVGMYEHVGRAQLAALRRGDPATAAPRAACSSTTASSRLHSAGPAGANAFIQRYVFPDGELQPVADVVAACRAPGWRSATSSRCASTTRSRCGAGWPTSRPTGTAIVAEVGVERERVWQLYMTGSALGFEDGDITVYQVLATRPDVPAQAPSDASTATEADAGGRHPTRSTRRCSISWAEL